MTINDADILVYVIMFAVLGGLCVVIGLFLRGRLEGLMVDPKLPDRLSEDEQDYRWSQLNNGVLTLLVVGTVLLFAALGLYIWGV